MKNYTGILSECQAVWIQIRLNLGPTCCKGYQQIVISYSGFTGNHKFEQFECSKIQGLLKDSFSSTFQGRFNIQGLFKNVLYIFQACASPALAKGW